MDDAVARGNEILRKFAGDQQGKLIRCARHAAGRGHRCGRRLSLTESWKSASSSARAWLPYLLVAPQLAITVDLLLLAGGPGAVVRLPAPGCLRHERRVRRARTTSAICSTTRPTWTSFEVTAVFSLLVAVGGIVIALLLAVMADRVIKGALAYRTLLIWPYAVAPAVAGVLWGFLFAPSIGILSYVMQADRHRLELGAQRQPGDGAGGDRIDLEADLLQLPVLPGRAAVDPALADRGRGDRRRAALPALLDHRLPAAVADHLLPAGGEHRLRLLRHLRRHRRRPRRAGPRARRRSSSTRSSTTA